MPTGDPTHPTHIQNWLGIGGLRGSNCVNFTLHTLHGGVVAQEFAKSVRRHENSSPLPEGKKAKRRRKSPLGEVFPRGIPRGPWTPRRANRCTPSDPDFFAIFRDVLPA